MHTHSRETKPLCVGAAHERKRKRHEHVIKQCIQEWQNSSENFMPRTKANNDQNRAKITFFSSKNMNADLCMQMMRHFRSGKKRRSENKVRHTKDTATEQYMEDKNDRTKEILDRNIIRIFFSSSFVFSSFQLFQPELWFRRCFYFTFDFGWLILFLFVMPLLISLLKILHRRLRLVLVLLQPTTS